MAWSIRRIAALAGAAVAALVLVVALADSGEDAPPPPAPTPTATPTPTADTANIWVDPDGGSCARAAKPGAYESASACGSLGAAYRAARGGDTILVRGGAYPAQRVRHDPRVRSRILLAAAPDEPVTLAGLLTFASHVHYRDFTLETGLDIRRGTDVVAERITAPLVGIASCERAYDGFNRLGSTGCGHIDGVLIKDSAFGPHTDVSGSYVKTMSAGGDGTAPDGWATDVVFDGVTFRDYRVPAADPGAHIDCLHVFHHGDGLVVRNSRFENCGAETDAGAPVPAGYGILWGSNKTGARTVREVVENSVFGRAGIAGFALRGGEGEAFNGGPTVRFNSGTSITPQAANELTGLAWYGNAVEDMPCRPGIAYAFNVIASGPCGATDAVSGVVDAGGPACPARDIDGDRRPQGAACDAGADERE